MATLVLAGSTSAQQSAKAFGQGGGFGGGGGEFSPAEVNRQRLGAGRPAYVPDEDNSEDRIPTWQSQQAIIAPGGGINYPLRLKIGQLLMAHAESPVLDCALQVLDAEGRVLAENKDRLDNLQEPFLRFVAPKEGTFQVRVLGQGGGGGQFLLRYLVADAVSGKLGQNPVLEPNERPREVFGLRVRLEKGKAYLVEGLDQNGFPAFSPYYIVGPVGIPYRDYQTLGNDNANRVIMPRFSGDYDILFLNVQPRFGNVVEIPVQPWPRQTNLDFSKSKVYLFEAPVREKEIRGVRTTGIGAKLTFEPAIEPPLGPHQSVPPETESFLTFSRSVEPTDQLFVFRKEGTARLVIQSQLSSLRSLPLTTDDGPKLWQDGGDQTAQLKVGESQFFLVDSKKAELMKVWVKASAFLPVMEIYNLDGQLQNRLSNRATLTATDDLYFPNEGRWLVSISCEGQGGSGTYQMRRGAPKLEPFKLGTSGQINLDGSNFGLFEVELEQGKSYEFRTDGVGMGVDLLDPDGQFLTSQRLFLGGVQHDYFIPLRSGKHRLWLRGTVGPRKFTLDRYDPRKVGG